MSFSRWKLMAGVLGVSLGGIAVAGTCAKFDRSNGRTADTPVAKADDKLPPAGAPAVPLIPLPAVPDAPAVPVLLPAGATTPPVLVAAPAAPTTPALPPIPGPAIPDAPKPEKPLNLKPSAQPTFLPAGATEPLPLTPPSAPVPPVVTPAPSKPDAKPAKPALEPQPLDAIPMPPVGDLIPPAAPPKATPPSAPPAPPVKEQPRIPEERIPPLEAQPMVPLVPVPGAAVPNVPPVAAVQDATKFRILLRVGEGEPTFEVKHGDNLVLKVACEKVDIKSPDKGTGLSEVVAKGKVQFAGFGAIGTCDELSFMAGSGEVRMTGNVKVQVKDKLGRIESELTTATMKYKIDASAIGGALKP